MEIRLIIEWIPLSSFILIPLLCSLTLLLSVPRLFFAYTKPSVLGHLIMSYEGIEFLRTFALYSQRL